MIKTVLFITTLVLKTSTLLCDDIQQTLQQPHIKPPSHSKFRDLVWGDINFIHTTDTHGWYSGHLNQKQYSGDWGDFLSFTEHIHKIADERGQDLLLVDTGDRHDGNGLSDATAVNGEISTGIFRQQKYDLVTLGNHELYTQENSIQEYYEVAKYFGDSYVSSNVEFKTDDGSWVPFGNKYRYFVTKNQAKRVLAFSFLFDFKRFNSRSRVTPIDRVVEQNWFNSVTSTFTEDQIDLLVVYGHLPITDLDKNEIGKLHIHLRRLYPNTVIQYFGGHSHIRDATVLDFKSTGLQSGRYCETLGWLSINTTYENEPQFNRRYIDFNRESFIHHLKTGEITGNDFDLKEGLDLSKYIAEQRKVLNLTYSYGYVPQSFLVNGYPYGHSSNLYTFLSNSILPTLEHKPNSDGIPKTGRAIIINTGGIRYDLYKGNFTKDTEFIVSPFQNNWNYIIVSKEIALKVAPYLNKQDYIMQLAPPESFVNVMRTDLHKKFVSLDASVESCPFIDKKDLKKGYTTNDEFGCDGDDVVHNTQTFYSSPNVIQSYEDYGNDSDYVELVFYDFIQPNILSALNYLSDRDVTYSNKDIGHYGGSSTGDLLREYVIKNWS